MNAPVVSILVPAYNIASFIDACLESVQAQTFAAWECIVVDDGSKDGTDKIVSAYADARIRLISQANAGVSHARNTALAEARGQYAMFLDGDDVLHPEALARLTAGLDAHPDCVAAFGTLRKILENGATYPGQKPLHRHRYPTGDVLEPMLRENFLANGGHLLLRTQIARGLGGFNTTLVLSEDWEFWCRLAATGPFFFIGNEPEVFSLRMRSGSSSGYLSPAWNNHRSSSEVVLNNRAISNRFSPRKWQSICRHIHASKLWESGRVLFTQKQFSPARKLMFKSLTQDPQLKRLVLFAFAQISQLFNISLVSRLRFADDDRKISGTPK